MSKVLKGIALWAALVAVGCGGDVKESFHCQVACDWANECIDNDVDIDDCHDDCFDLIDNNGALDRKAKSCQDCVLSEKCSDTEECQDDCFEVLDEAMPGWRD